MHSAGSSISLEEPSEPLTSVVTSGFCEGLCVVTVVGFLVVVEGLVVLVDASGIHCPGFGDVGTGLEPSEDGVLGGRAHSA